MAKEMDTRTRGLDDGWREREVCEEDVERLGFSHMKLVIIYVV